MLGLRTHVAIVAAAALGSAVAGCAEDHIAHGEEFGGGVGLPTTAGSITAGATSEAASAGNYPEPAITRCGDLPAGSDPIAGLATAWGVLALPNAHDPDGEAIEPGLMRLRLSDRPLFDCTEAFHADAVCASDNATEDWCGWGIEVSLSPDELQRTTIDLADSAYADFRLTIGEGGNTRQIDPRGSLVLHQVTPDCVIGEFVDIPLTPRAVLTQSGSFVAEVCQRQCIAGDGKGCWP